MNYYEPLHPLSESLLDSNEQQLRQLRSLALEQINESIEKQRILFDALTADAVTFPDFMVKSRFWLPVIATYAKPTLVMTPAKDDFSPQHRIEYRRVFDYYCKILDRDLEEHYEPMSQRYELHIVRPTFNVVFHSWRQRETHVVTTPPFISVNRPTHE